MIVKAGPSGPEAVWSTRVNIPPPFAGVLGPQTVGGVALAVPSVQTGDALEVCFISQNAGPGLSTILLGEAFVFAPGVVLMQVANIGAAPFDTSAVDMDLEVVTFRSRNIHYA